MESTAQKIIDAAIEVFNQDFSASLEKVAVQAGVTRRTLNRYFKERTHLMDACLTEMQEKCQAAMTAAYESSSNPVKKLEQMLYAGIDCGHKYSFLDKLHQRPAYQQMPEAHEDEFENIKMKWFRLVSKLQKEDIISSDLTVAWIFGLFGSVITTTINAISSGSVARNDVKKFAWLSFSRAVGVTSTEIKQS